MEENLSPADFYRLIRAQIEHEDNLNSQRLSWFVASQSFLFTAYAIVLTNLHPGTNPIIEPQQRLLVVLIPVAAILTCTLIYLTIMAGAVAMLNLHKLYRSQTPVVPAGFPPIQGNLMTLWAGQAGPLGLPPAFIVVWLILLMRHVG